MENSALQSFAGFAALMSVLSFIVGVVVLIVFFVMASNIGTITRVVKSMRMHQINMSNDISKIAGVETKAERERKFDDAIEAAKNREHSKI